MIYCAGLVLAFAIGGCILVKIVCVIAEEIWKKYDK